MYKLKFNLQRFVEIRNENTNDTLITGTSDGDSIFNRYGDNVTIKTGEGSDTIYNYDGENSFVFAGSGHDTIMNQGSNVVIYGEGDGDTLYNHVNWHTTISGGEGDDSIHNNDGWYAMVSGDDGNDTILSGGINVSITGGVGDDIISLSGGAYSADDNDFSQIKYAYGDGNDTIYNFDKDMYLSIIGTSTFSTTTGDSGELYVNFDNGQKITMINTADDFDNTNIGLLQGNIYIGGNQTISNYESGQKVNWSADLTGVNIFSGDDFIFSSSTGDLRIQNVRDKVVDFSVNNTTIAYLAKASGALDLDASSLSQFLILVGGNDASNNFKAGSGGSWLWGGVGGSDTLTGGSGADTFFFGRNDGTDFIYNASSSDVVNLYDVSINDFDFNLLDTSNNQISIALTNGANVKIQSSENLSAKITMTEGTVQFNHSTGQWQLA